jgi:hypothetical protein
MQNYEYEILTKMDKTILAIRSGRDEPDIIDDLERVYHKLDTRDSLDLTHVCLIGNEDVVAVKTEIIAALINKRSDDDNFLIRELRSKLDREYDTAMFKDQRDTYETLRFAVRVPFEYVSAEPSQLYSIFSKITDKIDGDVFYILGDNNFVRLPKHAVNDFIEDPVGSPGSAEESVSESSNETGTGISGILSEDYDRIDTMDKAPEPISKTTDEYIESIPQQQPPVSKSIHDEKPDLQADFQAFLQDRKLRQAGSVLEPQFKSMKQDRIGISPEVTKPGLDDKDLAFEPKPPEMPESEEPPEIIPEPEESEPLDIPDFEKPIEMPEPEETETLDIPDFEKPLEMPEPEEPPEIIPEPEESETLDIPDFEKPIEMPEPEEPPEIIPEPEEPETLDIPDFEKPLEMPEPEEPPEIIPEPEEPESLDIPDFEKPLEMPEPEEPPEIIPEPEESEPLDIPDFEKPLEMPEPEEPPEIIPEPEEPEPLDIPDFEEPAISEEIIEETEDKDLSQDSLDRFDKDETKEISVPPPVSSEETEDTDIDTPEPPREIKTLAPKLPIKMKLSPPTLKPIEKKLPLDEHGEEEDLDADVEPPKEIESPEKPEMLTETSSEIEAEDITEPDSEEEEPEIIDSPVPEPQITDQDLKEMVPEPEIKPITPPKPEESMEPILSPPGLSEPPLERIAKALEGANFEIAIDASVEGIDIIATSETGKYKRIFIKYEDECTLEIVNDLEKILEFYKVDAGIVVARIVPELITAFSLPEKLKIYSIDDFIRAGENKTLLAL